MSRRALLIAILIAALTLALSSRTLVPLRHALEAIVEPLAAPLTIGSESIRSIVASVSQIRLLNQETANLRNQNQALEAQLAQLASLKSENQALQSALKFSADRHDQQLLSAHVIARSPDSFLERFTIDRGSADGAAIGAPVIVNGFVVGVIVDQGAHRSTVKLITASDSAIAVVFVHSRAQGLLRGGLNGLVVGEVALDATVAVGEPVVSSSLGGILPADIPVGTARIARSLPSDIVQEIAVDTPVKLSALELVFVGQPVRP